MRRLIEGFAYSGADLIRVNTVDGKTPVFKADFVAKLAKSRDVSTLK